MGTDEIRVRVRFTGELADLAARRETTVILPKGAVLANLVDELGVRFGKSLAARLAGDPQDPFVYHVVAAVDDRFCGDPSSSQVPLMDGTRVVFIEPVAGGAKPFVEQQ